MNFINKLHLKVFGWVAKTSLVLWLVTPSTVVFLPWFLWATYKSYSDFGFGVVSALLAAPVIAIGLVGFRRQCTPGSALVLQVELRRGVLGFHIGKEVPSRADLCTNILSAVLLAQRLGVKAIRLESPLLVNKQRYTKLAALLQTVLLKNGLHSVAIVVIQPKRMLWLRSLAFTACRKLRKYDEKGAHLPPSSWFGSMTAGVRLELT